MSANMVAKDSVPVQARPFAKRKRGNTSERCTIMLTGKRLAKRSIIGTRVCAIGDDGYYYSGSISAVNTPQQEAEANGLHITEETRYMVRFDPVADGKTPDPKREYKAYQIIGSGFADITGAKLVRGQKVYLTYNTREVQSVVMEHRQAQNEVVVIITLPGQEEPVYLTRRIEDLRLLESRKSARLADTDTDFARLADVGSDRKRTSSHSIDMPQQRQQLDQQQSQQTEQLEHRDQRDHQELHELSDELQITLPHSREPEDSFSESVGREYQRIMDEVNKTKRRRASNKPEGNMDECSAAMVLMSLSTPPKNPPIHCQPQFAFLDGSSNSSHSSCSSSSSWSCNSPSPPLSDHITNGWHDNNSDRSPQPDTPPRSRNEPIQGIPLQLQENRHNFSGLNILHHAVALRSRVSPPEFVQHPDYENQEASRPRKRRLSFEQDEIEDYARRNRVHDPGMHNNDDVETDEDNQNDVFNENVEIHEDHQIDEVNENDNVEYHPQRGIYESPYTIYRCTWIVDAARSVRCGNVSWDWDEAAAHVLSVHFKGRPVPENEEDFYIIDENVTLKCSPPTKSHWDMVKPRRLDPLYRRHVRAALPRTENNAQKVAAVRAQDIIIRNVYPMTRQEPNGNGLRNIPNDNGSRNILNDSGVRIIPNDNDMRNIPNGNGLRNIPNGHVMRNIPNVNGIRNIIPNANRQIRLAPPRPLQASNNANVNVVAVPLDNMPNPTRRVRGDTKKCRKIYGMHQKDLWCTQCKWKKACSRYND